MAPCRRSLISLQERLRTIAEALPEGASITLSSEALRSLLETDADESSTLAHDMTVEQVAMHLERAPQTVRRWIREGDLEAYSFRGREYRITAAALQDFIARQQTAPDRTPSTPPVHLANQLGAWRSVRSQRKSTPSADEQPQQPGAQRDGEI